MKYVFVYYGQMAENEAVLEAASLDAATEMAKTSPLLHSGRQIAIFEVLPMPVRAQSSV